MSRCGAYFVGTDALIFKFGYHFIFRCSAVSHSSHSDCLRLHSKLQSPVCARPTCLCPPGAMSSNFSIAMASWQWNETDDNIAVKFQLWRTHEWVALYINTEAPRDSSGVPTNKTKISIDCGKLYNGLSCSLFSLVVSKCICSMPSENNTRH